MKITRWALEQDRVTAAGVLALVIAGVLAFFSLPRDEDPGFTIRVARVTTQFPGAGPERVERLVTDKLEEVIQRIEELDYVTSESSAGLSVINVQIRPEYDDLRPIWDDLRRKMNDARSALPDSVIGPQVNDDFGDVYGIVYAVTGTGFAYGALEQQADRLKDRLLQVDGVGRVRVEAEQAEQIVVEYLPERLAEYGLTPERIGNAIVGRNRLVPAGRWRLGQRRIVVEIDGRYTSVDAVANTLIPVDSHHALPLGQIAEVRADYENPPRVLARFNGQPALMVAVAHRSGSNVLEVNTRIEAAVQRLVDELPHGIEVHQINDQPQRVRRAVDQFVVNLLQAVGVVLLVLLLFLGVRTGLVVAALVPAVILLTLALMQATGIGLDRVSLAALIIALGIVVDNGIVMAENIQVQIGGGTDPTEAAIESAQELRWPLLVSSLTTAAAFLPIYLAEEQVGEYTAPLFLVVSIALLSSWVLSMTALPLLCARALSRDRSPAANPYDRPLYRRYRRFLLLALRHRILAALLLVAMFIGAVLGLRQVPSQFFPPSENAFFKVELEWPIDTAIEQTAKEVARIDRFIESQLLVEERSDAIGVTSWASYIGYNGPRYILQHRPEAPKSNYAFLLVNVSDWERLGEPMDELGGWIRSNLAGVTATVRRISNGPGLDHPIGVRLLGPDIDQLQGLSSQVQQQLESIDGTFNIRDDWGEPTQKLMLRIDPVRAQALGVTHAGVAEALATGLSGVELSQYRADEDLVPILLRGGLGDDQNRSELLSTPVYSPAMGAYVPLGDVADTELQWEPALIYRKNRQRNITVTADMRGGLSTSTAIAALDPWLQSQQREWPPGYHYEYGGEYESSADANAAIGVKLPVAGLLIALFLVLQFNSFRQAGVVLLTVPLGLIGVTIGLLATGSWFGFMTLLGLISLSGILINNAIVLIDRIQIERSDNGHERPQAVLMAAQRRLRPILLTAGTTALGMAPLWLSGGALFQSMAIAIIFGLLFATLLSLVAVPVLYSLMYRVRYAAESPKPTPKGPEQR